MTILKTKVSFILARLKNLSIPEVLYRLSQIAWMQYIKYSGNKPSAPAVDQALLQTLKFPFIHGNFSGDETLQIISGTRYTLNQDPKMIFAFENSNQISSAQVKRQDERVDIRAVWEPARLQHVYQLLQSRHGSSESTSACLAENYTRDDILKWIDKNPFYHGPHYLSAMECGLRIPVFVYALLWLPNLSEADRQKIISTIYEHAWLIIRKLSLYSSLGNHTICEAVGIIFEAAIFRDTVEGKTWIKRGIELLTQETTHQILDDGGPAEQSFNYHRFVLDLYWLAVDFMEKNQIHDCAKMKPRLVKGEAFMKCFQGDNGKLPHIGDSDDGFAVAPGLFPLRMIPDVTIKDICHFADSGYTVIKDSKGACIVFDHGPLGMPPLYNHGHADALSVILNIKGLELLVDTGTFQYNGVPEYRKYFKSTRAHNTVTIDGQDQAVQETGFIWSHPYKTEVVRKEVIEKGFFIEALHTGYRRLQSPVTHKRVVFQTNGLFIVRDSFEGPGIHEFELNYHLHPEANVNDESQWWHIQRDDAVIHMKMLYDDSFQYVSGQEEPLLGWYSAAYGLKERCGVLCCRKAGSARNVTFTTIIGVDVVPDLDKINSLLGRMI